MGSEVSETQDGKRRGKGVRLPTKEEAEVYVEWHVSDFFVLALGGFEEAEEGKEVF
jgi:hypothetical protein